MKKVDCTRDIFKSSLLKQVIIRADYSYITDLNRFITELKSWSKDFFSGYRIIRTNSIDLRIDSIAISNRQIPVDIKETENIHRFYDSQIIPKQDTTIDISSNFICITIDCDENYGKIDPYLDYISEVMEKLKSYDSYVQFNRLAIRKIDGSDFDNLDKAYEIFEKINGFEDSIIENVKKVKQSYTDIFISENANLKINLTRSIEHFPSGNVRYVLDTDGYIDSVTDLSKKDDYLSLFNNINNELFRIFKINVTETFLNNGTYE